MPRSPLNIPNSVQPDAPRATPGVVVVFVVIVALHILLRMIFFEGIGASDPLRYVRIAYQRLSGDFGLVYEQRAARFGANHVDRDRARQPVGRDQIEPIGDRVARIPGSHRHFRPGAKQLPHAADVDHDVVADLDSPLVVQ